MEVDSNKHQEHRGGGCLYTRPHLSSLAPKKNQASDLCATDRLKTCPAIKSEDRHRRRLNLCVRSIKLGQLSNPYVPSPGIRADADKMPMK